MQFKWMSPIIVVLAFVLAVGMVGAQDDATPEPPFGERMPFGMGGERGFGLNIDTVLEATGLSVEELRSALAEGSTIAELIAANGGDLDALIAEAVAQREERLATAVENGRLTQEEADAQLAQFEATLSAWANGEIEMPFRDGFGGPDGRGGRR